MLPIPDAILKRFDAILEKRDVAPALRADFKKWLRYFLDFCAKYPPPAARSDQVRLFIDKLREKRQTLDQQKQAAYAVSLPRPRTRRSMPCSFCLGMSSNRTSAITKMCPAQKNQDISLWSFPERR